MIKINLLPHEIHLETKESSSQQDVFMLIGVGLVLLLVGSFYGFRLMKVRKLTVTRDLIQQELNQLQTTVTQVENLERQREMLNKKLGVITSLIRNRLVYPKFMEALSSRLPKNVWINNMTTVSDASSMTVNVSGVSFTNFGVADTMDMFEKDETFAKHIGEINLGGIQSSVVNKNVKSFNFTLSGVYKY
ncbi:PilN domain-containing protein [bacterium]|nr:PilN domain-containing protein [bacterium]